MTTIYEAIERSASHNEIVRVSHQDFRVAFGEISVLSDDYDYAKENVDGYDVWGTTDEGKEFRLRLVSED